MDTEIQENVYGIKTGGESNSSQEKARTAGLLVEFEDSSHSRT